MPSNPLDTATALNITASPTALSNAINSANPDKIYRFSLTSRSSLNASVSGLSADANVQLIQDRNRNGVVDAGDVLASSTQSGTTAESISRALEPGTYFVRVYAGTPGISTNYRLNAFAPQAAQSGSVATDYGSDGKLKTFAIGADNNVWAWQESDNNFTYWHKMGLLAKTLQVIQGSDGKLDVFGIGLDDKAWEWKESDNNFTYWHDLGFKAKSLEVTSSGDGRVNVFGISLDDKAWEWKESDNNFTYWHDLGFKAKSLQVVQSGDGNLNAFGVGLDDKAWEWKESDNNFTYWHDLGFKAKSLQITQGGDTRIVVFGVGLDDKAWEWKESDNNFTYWHDLGFKAKTLQAVRGGDGKLDVVAAGLDGDTWQWRESDNNFTYWHKMGLAPKLLQPVLGSDGRLNIFAISSDNNEWQWRESDNNFTYWRKMGLLARDPVIAIGYDGSGVNITYINTFNRIGGSSFAGYAADNVHRSSNGYVQDFSGGSEGKGIIMKSDANDNSYWVGGDFLSKFLAVEGVTGLLGYPTSDRINVATSVLQTFQGGSIFKTSKGIFAIYGNIGNYYLQTAGGNGGRLGLPTSDQQNLSGSVIRQNFENGYILWNGSATAYKSDGSLLFPPPASVNSGSTYTGGATNGIPVNWNSRAYREDNLFWRAGYAPSFENPPYPKLGNALGNCTWYANGRLRELGFDSSSLDKLYGNANDWDDEARAAGITLSHTPQVGVIAQWESGHVAVVEKVNADGTILISESSYASSGRLNYLYETRTISASNPNNYIIVSFKGTNSNGNTSGGNTQTGGSNSSGSDSIRNPLDEMTYQHLAIDVAYDISLKKNDTISYKGHEYIVNEIFDDSGALFNTGFRAIGLAPKNANDPYVLDIRGTEINQGSSTRLLNLIGDADPSGIGYLQFVANASRLETWLSNHKYADVIGHSLGGAIAQEVAADFTHKGGLLGRIETFNSPGVNYSYINDFNSSKVQGVTHYIVAGDIVSLAGSGYLPGEYKLISFNDLNILEKHIPPNNKRLGNSGVNESSSSSVTYLSSPSFHYENLDYFAFLLAVGSLSPTLAASLVTRRTVEANRELIGASGYLISEALYKVGEFEAKALDTVSHWSSDTWNATTYWSADAWNAASHWSADAWNASSHWSSDTWNATTHWSADAWNNINNFWSSIWKI